MNNQNEIAEQLRQLSRVYVNTQQYRIRYSNLLGISKVKDTVSGGKFQYINDDDLKLGVYNKFKSFKEIEHDLEKKMKQLLKQHSWSAWLLSIKGVGPVIAASIIGELNGAIYGSIAKGKTATKAALKGYGREFESTADLWSFAGWGVEDGKARKRESGEKANWNKYLKLTCYKFAESMIKAGGEYRQVYDARKAYERTNYPQPVDSGKKTKEGKKVMLYTDMHIHKRAMRYTIKKFLSNINHNLILNQTSTV